MPKNLPHNWAEVRVLPISIEKDPDTGKLLIYSSPEAVEVADELPSYICYDCKADPREEGVLEEPCPGAVRAMIMDDA